MGNKAFWFSLTALGAAAAFTAWLLSPGKTSTPDTAGMPRYIGNQDSKKLHLPDCRVLPEENTRVYYTDRQKALDDGYVPCGICKP